MPQDNPRIPARLPSWLQQDEHYTPLADKDAFMDRTILSFMRLLSVAKAQEHRPQSLFKVNPFFGILFTLMLIVLVSLSTKLTFLFVVIAYLLLILCVMPVKDIIHTLRVSLAMALITALILIPTVFLGNYFSIIMIPAKVLLTLMAVNILARSARWNRIITALRRFYVPNLFIFVLDITLKYLVMLGEFALEMIHALKLRSVGKNRSKQTGLGGITGTLFIRSREMAEEMYQAMECRGFDGEYPIDDKFRFGLADAVYLLINGGILWVFIYLY